MADSFEKVLARMQQADQEKQPDQSALLRKLDSQQRATLTLFTQFEIVTSKQIGDLLGYKPRNCALLCAKWVQEEFLEVANVSNKARKYRLAAKFSKLITGA